MKVQFYKQNHLNLNEQPVTAITRATESGREPVAILEAETDAKAARAKYAEILQRIEGEFNSKPNAHKSIAAAVRAQIPAARLVGRYAAAVK